MYTQPLPAPHRGSTITPRLPLALFHQSIVSIYSSKHTHFLTPLTVVMGKRGGRGQGVGLQVRPQYLSAGSKKPLMTCLFSGLLIIREASANLLMREKKYRMKDQKPKTKSRSSCQRVCNLILRPEKDVAGGADTCQCTSKCVFAICTVQPRVILTRKMWYFKRLMERDWPSSNRTFPIT